MSLGSSPAVAPTLAKSLSGEIPSGYLKQRRLSGDVFVRESTPAAPALLVSRTETRLLIDLPPYLPSESFFRLSSYAQQKVLSLLLFPPAPPPAYVEKEERFRAAGYTSYQHHQIARILEQLDY